MSIVGKWTFHFSWGCNGVYTQDTVTFDSNGTFLDSFGGQGNWVEDPGMMELQYNPPSRTNYSGNVQGSAMVGISTTFSGLNGCWYAIKEGAQTFARTERAPTHEMSGAESHS